MKDERCLSCRCTFATGCKFERLANERAAAKRLESERPAPNAKRLRGSSAGTGFRQKMRAFKAELQKEVSGA